MANKSSDVLYQLIQSLTKAEKRSFKLYANRAQNNADLKFITLFDILDKQKEYDEVAIFKKMPSLKKHQLSNLKAHLYRQVLTSLRLLEITHNKDIEIREFLDYARVLYNKGLYVQSLKILEKAKLMASKINHMHLWAEIVEFEKLIESRFVTKSNPNRSEEITEESQHLNRITSEECDLSNLSLKLYGLYLKVGHSRNERDHIRTKEFFDSNLPDYDPEALTFHGKLYLYQSYVWYHYINQDFIMCYRYAQKWVDLFEENPEMKLAEADMYMKGMHNLLAALFNTSHHEKFVAVYQTFKEFTIQNESRFNLNESLLAFVYRYTNKINLHFMEGRFSDGTQFVKEIEEGLNKYHNKLDDHRILTTYYKIACLYFGGGEYKMAIKYLNRIINYQQTEIREDIQCFARILSLIAHFELGNDDLIEYQIKSVYRFLMKMEDIQLVQKEIFQFLKKTFYMERQALIPAFVKLKERLVAIEKNEYEKRPFLYLDIISWLESKIENRPVQDIIREKFERNRG